MFICDDQANSMKFGPRFFEYEKKILSDGFKEKTLGISKGKWLNLFDTLTLFIREGYFYIYIYIYIYIDTLIYLIYYFIYFLKLYYQKNYITFM